MIIFFSSDQFLPQNKILMELASALANFCINICGKTPQQVK
jgi:hypothetical protein